MKAVKQFEVLEEGCCKLTLSAKKEYDPYMLSLIEREASALLCRSKGASTTIFYYDNCEHLPLLTLLSKYEFTEKEACACLERLFEESDRLANEYPLLLRFDSIYYDPLRQRFAFVLLPIHERVLEHDWNGLLAEIIAHINVRKAAFYGFLCSMQKQEHMTASQIVKQFRVWQLQHTLWRQLSQWFAGVRNQRMRKKQNEQRLQEELIRLRFIHRSSNHEAHFNNKSQRQTSDTVVLFAEHGSCLSDLKGNTYSLQSETHIGRNKNNDIVIDHATVSSYHAVIKQTAEGMKLIDLGSSNGTKLNNKKLNKQQEIVLKNGDTILFADSCWRFEEET